MMLELVIVNNQMLPILVASQHMPDWIMVHSTSAYIRVETHNWSVYELSGSYTYLTWKQWHGCIFCNYQSGVFTWALIVRQMLGKAAGMQSKESNPCSRVEYFSFWYCYFPKWYSTQILTDIIFRLYSEYF